jgi:hypothetical protein
MYDNFIKATTLPWRDSVSRLIAPAYPVSNGDITTRPRRRIIIMIVHCISKIILNTLYVIPSGIVYACGDIVRVIESRQGIGW